MIVAGIELVAGLAAVIAASGHQQIAKSKLIQTVAQQAKYSKSAQVLRAEMWEKIEVAVPLVGHFVIVVDLQVHLE